MTKKNKIIIIITLWILSIVFTAFTTSHIKDNKQYYSILKSMSKEERKILDKIEITEEIQRIITCYFNDGTSTTETINESKKNTITK